MKRLLASIHDVGPRSEREVDALLERLSGHLGGPRLAMLVVPDHWGEAPLVQGTPFATRLRGWAETGVEMFVHGWFHRDTSEHHGIAALKARHMTASEGEFLGLDHATALDRMTRGKALVEDIIGRPAAGFIAPAWLYSDGALAALGEAGFALAENHGRVWSPVERGRVLTRGPVITWASRSNGRQLSSLAAAAVLRRLLQPAKVVRVAVHPGDAHVPRLLESIDRTFRAFARGGRVPSRYADLR
ncbi:DUF2334 domain-containing protein [Sphingomonas sp. CL5.1]|uniref:DUF2334 domain-containing protein n=1 Tax=Sphingomonas sp. CL5.1 TaxID=2653203 RepID=UPI001583A06E|nr:polysaccharide deacetylase family protein [Sphingomonas sp. CL5.1]QKR98772.1 DUF2334 domain-containing protein [Sphingomonas sp. CL5.1]